MALNCKAYLAATTGVGGCKNKNVHLTFDDGPNTKETPKILAALKRQKVPATFFISTHQLEKGDIEKKEDLLKEMIRSGHTVASHGHDHNCHDIRKIGENNFEAGYTDEQRRDQVEKSIKLLNDKTDNFFDKQKHRLIRFPYGRGISPSNDEINEMIKSGRKIPGSSYSERLTNYRKESPAMSVASESKLDHIGWNHDSRDATSDFSIKSKDKYVTSIISYMCKSKQNNLMSLFHDVKPINSAPSSLDKNKIVMDEIIEKAKCLGINFKSMDQMLQGKLQAGIHIESYLTDEKIVNMSDQIGKISDSPIGLTCSTTEKNYEKPQGSSCTSKSGKTFKHCEGVSSFCIDGKWITNKNLYEMACEEGFSVEATKELSSKYLNKSCEDQRGIRKIIEPDEAVCDCQENEAQNDKLMWNCFDIRSGVAKRIK